MYALLQRAVFNGIIIIVIIHQNGWQTWQVIINRNGGNVGIVREFDNPDISWKEFYLIREIRISRFLEPVIFMPAFPVPGSLIPLSVPCGFYKLPEFCSKIRRQRLHNQYNVYVLGRPWSLCIYFFMHFTGSTTYDDIVSFISGEKLPEFINSSYHIILFIIVSNSIWMRSSSISFMARNKDNLSTMPFFEKKHGL